MLQGFDIYSLKPCKLKRYFKAKYPSSINRDVVFFRHEVDRLIKSRLDDTGMSLLDITAGLKAFSGVSREITGFFLYFFLFSLEL